MEVAARRSANRCLRASATFEPRLHFAWASLSQMVRSSLDLNASSNVSAVPGEPRTPTRVSCRYVTPSATHGQALPQCIEAPASSAGCRRSLLPRILNFNLPEFPFYDSNRSSYYSARDLVGEAPGGRSHNCYLRVVHPAARWRCRGPVPWWSLGLLFIMVGLRRMLDWLASANLRRFRDERTVRCLGENQPCDGNQCRDCNYLYRFPHANLISYSP